MNIQGKAITEDSILSRGFQVADDVKGYGWDQLLLVFVDNTGLESSMVWLWISDFMRSYYSGP